MNNFDQSSKGVNLELSIFRDCERGREEFEESFHVVQHSNRCQNSILVFNPYGDLGVSDFDPSDIDNYDLKSATKKHLLASIEDMESVKNEALYYGKSFSKLTKTELLECILETFYHNSNKLDYLQNMFTPKFAKVASYGYRQGDYSEVYIPQCLINEFEGQTPETIGSYLQSSIDNLIWSAPIYAHLSIDEDYIYIDELLEDPYVWDKQQILEKIDLSEFEEDKQTVIMEFLEDNLEEYL